MVDIESTKMRLARLPFRGNRVLHGKCVSNSNLVEGILDTAACRISLGKRLGNTVVGDADWISKCHVFLSLLVPNRRDGMRDAKAPQRAIFRDDAVRRAPRVAVWRQLSIGAKPIPTSGFDPT